MVTINELDITHSDLLIYQIDTDGTLISCNKSFANIINLTGNSPAKKIWEYFSENKFAERSIIESTRHILSYFEPTMVTEYYYTSEGQLIECVSQKIPISNHSENNTVITISTKSSRAVKFTDTMSAIALENIIANMPGHVYWKDKHGIYLGCNDMQAKSLGLNKGTDVIGKNDYELPWPKHSAEEFRKNDMKVMNNGEILVTEENAIIDGKNAIVLSNKIPLYNNGEITGILGLSIDITDLKDTQNKLKESYAREERLKVLSSMGGMIAHELRTPLAGITFGMNSIGKHLEVLINFYKNYSCEKDESSISPHKLESLIEIYQDIKLSLAQIDNTVNTVLAGFKPNQISSDKLKQQKVDDLFSNFLKIYPLTQQELKLLSIEYDENIYVKCIPQVLLHVLSNLVKNSLYHIQEVGKGKIFISTVKQNDSVLIQVKDTAKGISPDNLNKIFDPFFTTKSAAASIGMGLYFCRLAIESMGGKITCDSVEGEYAVFTLKLPIG